MRSGLPCLCLVYRLNSKYMPEIEDFPLAMAEGDIIEPMMQVPSVLPALPLRDIVIYPFMIVPLFVSRDKSIKAVEEALKENRMIVLVSQRDVNKEDPAPAATSEVSNAEYHANRERSREASNMSTNVAPISHAYEDPYQVFEDNGGSAQMLWRSASCDAWLFACSRWSRPRDDRGVRLRSRTGAGRGRDRE